ELPGPINAGALIGTTAASNAPPIHGAHLQPEGSVSPARRGVHAAAKVSNKNGSIGRKRSGELGSNKKIANTSIGAAASASSASILLPLAFRRAASASASRNV